MTEDKQVAIDSWADFAGEFLKTDLVAEFPVKLPVLDIFGQYDEKKNKNRLFINTEYMRKEWKIELNKTNQGFIRSAGIKAPQELIGKVLVFDKTKVRNPSTNAQVDSFILVDIE